MNRGSQRIRTASKYYGRRKATTRQRWAGVRRLIKPYKRNAKNLGGRRLPFKFNVAKSGLTKCGLEFILAQFNPWHPSLIGPCMPDLITTPSRKIKYMVKGSFSIGSSNVGFVSFNPYLPFGSEAFSGPPANPNFAAPVWKTQSSYASSAIALQDAVSSSGIVPSGLTHAYLDSEFIADDNTNSNVRKNIYDWRVVAAGIKMKYSGAPLNRQGTYVLYENQNNDAQLTDNPVTTESDLLQMDTGVTQLAIDEREHFVVWHPRNKWDFDYISESTFDLETNSFTVSEVARYVPLLIAAFGGEPGATVTFDIVVHYEFVGSGIPSKTKSESDQGALGANANGIPKAPSGGNADAEGKKKLKGAIVNLAGQTVGSMVEGYMPGLGAAANQAVKAAGNVLMS